MRTIFISYRREDTEGHAGRLFRNLCERCGKEVVFMDVAGIEPGRDFRRVIEQQVASCGLLLTLIGNGFNLLGWDTTYQQVVQGCLILFAVTVDRWLRRRST